MAGLVNISEMTAQGLHLMLALSNLARESESGRLNARKIAADLGVSAHTLHKVVSRLVNAGLIDSARGANGGLRLARSPKTISLEAIIQAVDGAICPNHCLFSTRLCPGTGPCPFIGLTGKLERQIHDYFHNTTLADIVGNPADNSLPLIK